MASHYCTTRRVEFRDTDTAGIMHFSAYFTYMEEAEHEFLRHLGLSVHMRDEQGVISWPRASARCDFLGAARFEDVFQIHVSVARLGEKSVTYRFRFTRDDTQLALGSITAVCCRLDPGQPPRSIPIPTAIAQKLGQFVTAEAERAADATDDSGLSS
jgi:4-hydroxybenzoyl-CoA thioesterase/acyl-CoA thioester hydrolase